MKRFRITVASALAAIALVVVPAMSASAATPRHTWEFPEQRACLTKQNQLRSLGYVIFSPCEQVWRVPSNTYYYKMVASLRPV
ncbi:hypothetical protein AB0N73_05525 [Microbacterium sp. NPDC089189]|uniref:hypothetical protein n=1 Tax=Microbacterium sp. NPDC089189 TaxID=3154972 RepID=UPI0034182CBE